jgi:hypothetical protein
MPIRRLCVWRLYRLIACATVLSFASTALADETASSAATAATSSPTTKSPASSTAHPKPAQQLRDGRVILAARDATVHGKHLRYESTKDTLGYWFDAGDWVSWQFEIKKPGNLIVELVASCDSDSAGSHYSVEIGNQRLQDRVQNTGSFRRFLARRAGTLDFDKPGTYTLSIHVIDKPALAVMDLRAVVLTPPNYRPAIATPPKK